MKIRRKISLFFIVQFLIAILSMGLLTAWLSARIVKEEIFRHLETAVESRVNHLETYFEKNIERLKLITSRTKLRNVLASYNESPNEKDKSEIYNIIKDAIEPIKDFERICILDLSGQVIMSTNSNFIGKQVAAKEFFIKGQREFGVYFQEDEGESRLFVSGPFILDNKLLGVALIVTDLLGLQEIISDKTGLGQTGEILIAQAGNEGEIIYLSEKRFPSSTAKDSPVLAQPMKEVLKKIEKRSDNQLDYRGVEIFSITRHMEPIGLGVVAKIDKDEALRPIDNLVWLFFAIAIFLVSVFSLIMNFLVHLITKPIEKLKNAAQIIEAGDLEQKIEMKTKDEIGELADTFNNMVKSIKKSRADVDKRVKEQTLEIQNRAKQLHDQQKAILNILEDVQEEKDNVSQEKNKIDRILHSIGDGVFVVDKDLKIVVFNQVAADISGYSVKEALGKRYDKVLNFIFEDTRKVNDKFLRDAIMTGEVQEMSNHTLLIRKDKIEVPVADSAAPLKSKEGRVIGCVVVFRDVSKEREIDKAKTEFVSLASHQLRTPLSAINWYAEMLIAGDAGKLTPEQSEYIEEIYTGNQRMVSLVNALLDTSRIELGTFTVEPENLCLSKILNSVLKELDQKIKEKNIKLTTTIDKSIDKYFGDPKLLNIIFQNLLTNSVKYTPAKGRIGVKIEKEKDSIRLVFSDSGMGIPERQQDKIFTKLFRADNVRETDTEGTGLGLYIIKSIVDHSGGQIWFESKENKGTNFYIKLPSAGMKKKTGTKKLGG